MQTKQICKLADNSLGGSCARTIFLRNNNRRHVGTKVTQQCDGRFAVRRPVAVVAVAGGDGVLVALRHVCAALLRLNGSGGARVIS